MHPWIALYLKELKENRNMFLFLLLALIGLESVGAHYYDSSMFGTPASVAGLPFLLALIGCVVAPPFVLSHAFSTELRSNNHYLRFALPVRVSVSSLCKYLAVATGSCVLYAVALTGLYLTEPRVFTELGFRISAWPIFLGYLAFWLGMAFAISALRFSLKRHQGLATGAFFVGSLYLYFKVQWWVTISLVSWGQLVDQADKKGIALLDSHAAFPGIYGLALLALGLWIFEKRAEV